MVAWKRAGIPTSWPLKALLLSWPAASVVRKHGSLEKCRRSPLADVGSWCKEDPCLFVIAWSARPLLASQSRAEQR
jgi:hypothetical protein